MVVDAACLVPLGTQDVQAACGDDLVAILVAAALRLFEGGPVFVGLRVEDAGPLLVEDLGGHHLRVAAEQDVGASPGHVGGDGHGIGSTCLRNDLRLALMELGVQHVVLDAAPLQHLREHLADLDADGTDQHRPAQLVLGDDLVDHGVPLALLGTEDEVGKVVPNHLPIRGDDDDLEAIDLAELLPLGLGSPGHAGQLVVHAEVVLEGDRRERL